MVHQRLVNARATDHLELPTEVAPPSGHIGGREHRCARVGNEPNGAVTEDGDAARINPPADILQNLSRLRNLSELHEVLCRRDCFAPLMSKSVHRIEVPADLRLLADDGLTDF